jgi:hypothetical protein
MEEFEDILAQGDRAKSKAIPEICCSALETGVFLFPESIPLPLKYDHGDPINYQL